MMIIKKTRLCELEKAYAIQLIELNGEEYCIVSSENRAGKTALVNLKTGRVQRIDGLAGGVMCLVPDKGASFFAIQKFYPVFQSEKAEIVRFTINLGDGEVLGTDVETVARLPYVHRILTLGVGRDKVIVAGTLCAEKAFEQDWSQPGSVWLVPAEAGSEPSRLFTPIHKHHGMWRSGAGSSVLVSGQEGVYEVRRDGGAWQTERLLGGEVSDMCMFDLDGDGLDEMVTVEPFHGDRLAVYRNSGNAWLRIAEERVSFCHAIWAGEIDGSRCVVACNRGGEKDISLYTIESRDSGCGIRMKRHVVDTGAGAANIVVSRAGGRTALYAANHGGDEAARYILEK
ncbi:MAG: hypothetical protein LBS53_09915 [Synergistaceae bacterium]|nr:hypothetical protein [Synergistaceae bacterium]